MLFVTGDNQIDREEAALLMVLISLEAENKEHDKFVFHHFRRLDLDLSG